MSRRTVVALALAATAALPSHASAARYPVAEMVATDGAVFLAVEDVAKPGFSVSGAAVRYRVLRVRQTASGWESIRYDYVVACLARAAGRLRESGCTWAFSSDPVTTGTVLPENGTVSARVAIDGRRDGWIAADLTLTANALPYVPPASGSFHPSLRDVAGVDVPAGGSASAGVYRIREAGLTGAVRTDRTRLARVRAYPRPYGTAVFWTDATSARAYADPVPVMDRLREAALAALPA